MVSTKSTNYVHTGKTEAMYISCSPFVGPMREIKFGEDTIEFKQESKSLGVIIDNSLSWKSQVEAVCKKFMSKICFFLRRLKSLPTETQTHYTPTNLVWRKIQAKIEEGYMKKMRIYCYPISSCGGVQSARLVVLSQCKN